jgi:DNA-binding transcriptional LysR family regulator
VNFPTEKDMDVNWLRDFLALAERRSFAKAAIARNLSAAALTRHIQMLETWAGTDLVDRSGHPIELTPAGEKLMPVAQAVLGSLDRVNAQFRDNCPQTAVCFLVPHTVSLTVFHASCRSYSVLHLAGECLAR